MSDGTPGTDLVPFDPASSSYPVLFEGNELAEVLAENFGSDGFQAGDLDRIKIPSQGGMYWLIPDEPPADALEGVLVYKQMTRSFWIKALGDGESSNEPPDCASADGVLGNGTFGPGSDGNPSGECNGCPMNSFGSAAKGEGKACKEQHQLWLLREGNVLPTQVSLPPTSLKDFRKWLLRLTAKARPYYGVVLRLKLRTEKGPAGDFSIAVPEIVRALAPEERAAAKRYGEMIASSVRKSFAARDEALARAAEGDGTGAVARDGYIDTDLHEPGDDEVPVPPPIPTQEAAPVAAETPPAPAPTAAAPAAPEAPAAAEEPTEYIDRTTTEYEATAEPDVYDGDVPAELEAEA